ncbi:helix-turn-helix domain-containing protein [Selenomonas sp. KH1T6]|uniref:helix-turn-helix domain-containing protein n=1 Tax=Selenomonas sp. KH1T6 TaxID=3158784 RepID=UPI0008A77CEF|nr:Helix-turn-helix domain of resolvase [Selenomonas ruminantium]
MESVYKSHSLKLVNRQSVSGKRPELRKALGGKSGYVLQGSSDSTIIVAIPDFENGRITLAVDVPAIENKGREILNRDEEYREISLGADAFRALIDIVVENSGMELVSARNKGGRPSKYSQEDAERITTLKKQGYSIREIAKKEEMSTTTVQKLLKQQESMELLKGISLPDED